eukprot:7869908-Pyramimonas_sp.AAC.1
MSREIPPGPGGAERLGRRGVAEGRDTEAGPGPRGLRWEAQFKAGRKAQPDASPKAKHASNTVVSY